LGYNYDIQYKARGHNKVADAPSRVLDWTGQFFGITIPYLNIFRKVQEGYKTDQELVHLLKQVEADPQGFSEYQIISSVMFYRGKIYLSTKFALIPLLLEEYHATPIGGHAGILKTYGRLSENFF